MDQSKAKVPTIDMTDSGSVPVTSTEVDSGFSSAGSTHSVHQGGVSTNDNAPGVLRLRLAKPERPQRRVGFHAGVIDNEHMNRRKSKCCCIYRKPHPFGESSSSTDDECEHCFGHPEMKTYNRMAKQLKKAEQGCSCCSHRLGTNRNVRRPMERIVEEKEKEDTQDKDQKSLMNNGKTPTGEELREE
ncbi:type 1 phosphatases regulator YPI1 [Drosophila eugracilis]|uniref:type 1 phosphatases regulator YPI1 n=1 Tax=Drosophila eugracilis TaxID=29029 RepID=UPI0007E71E5F|nr:type 1 phosphatases regulator YPI1 [Drosophila eugracilis]